MVPQDSCSEGGDTISQQQLGHFSSWVREGHNWILRDFFVLTWEGKIIKESLPVTRVTTLIQIPSDLPRPGHRRDVRHQLCALRLGKAELNQAWPMTQPRALVSGNWAPLWWKNIGDTWDQDAECKIHKESIQVFKNE